MIIFKNVNNAENATRKNRRRKCHNASIISRTFLYINYIYNILTYSIIIYIKYKPLNACFIFIVALLTFSALSFKNII